MVSGLVVEDFEGGFEGGGLVDGLEFHGVGVCERRLCWDVDER